MNTLSPEDRSIPAPLSKQSQLIIQLANQIVPDTPIY